MVRTDFQKISLVWRCETRKWFAHFSNASINFFNYLLVSLNFTTFRSNQILTKEVDVSCGLQVTEYCGISVLLRFSLASRLSVKITANKTCHNFEGTGQIAAVITG